VADFFRDKRTPDRLRIEDYRPAQGVDRPKVIKRYVGTESDVSSCSYADLS
jgi:hypothetical protein